MDKNTILQLETTSMSENKKDILPIPIDQNYQSTAQLSRVYPINAARFRP
jgi:hypothetical protein